MNQVNPSFKPNQQGGQYPTGQFQQPGMQVRHFLEQKRMNNPQMMQQPQELQLQQVQVSTMISPRIYEPYGPNYDPEKGTGSAYEGCIKAYASPWGGCFSCCVQCGCGPIAEINQMQVGFLSEFGKFKKILPPGIHSYNPCYEDLKVVSNAKSSINLPRQELLTKELLMVTIDSNIIYGFAQRDVAFYTLASPDKLLIYSCLGIMKSLVADRTLKELQEDLVGFQKSCFQMAQKAIHRYGIDVYSIDITNIILPPVLIRALAIESEARKENQGKIKRAEGYLNSASLYAKASKEYEGNNLAIEMNYYELLRGITNGKKSTTILRDTYYEND